LIDLLDRELVLSRLRRILPFKRALLERAFELDPDLFETADWDIDVLVERYCSAGDAIAPYLCDTAELLAEARGQGVNIIYEGAQSFGLDIDQGTYPFCSSGHSSANGVHVGTGTPPSVRFEVFGVIKCYTSQVGGGPLPTEIVGPIADHIVSRGHEYGVVTGRRRRVGWLDLPSLRRAVARDGCSALCISSLDVLAGLKEVKVATHYTLRGRRLDGLPRSLADSADAQPAYETFAGWEDADWNAIVDGGLAALPENARRLITFVTQDLGTPLAAVGVGPSRDQTIVVRDPFC